MSKEFSRRSFLKGAAATAVSAAIFSATGVSLAEEKAALDAKTPELAALLAAQLLGEEE